MKLSEFDYDLPKDLIAQHPLPSRDGSRLMVLDRKHNTIDHVSFTNFPDYLHKGDLVILNNTRVFPARLIGHKKNTSGKVELLLTRELEPGIWKTMIKCSGKVKENMEIDFNIDTISAVVVGKNKIDQADNNYGSEWIVQFNSQGNVTWQGHSHMGYRPDVQQKLCQKNKVPQVSNTENILKKIGLVPLPPYIKRNQDKPSSLEDKERYQTIYASKTGAIAAPTAGLHFTGNTFKKLKEKGVEIAELTLHVGAGTFKPVKAKIIQEHSMDSEYYEIDNPSVEKIKKALSENRRIITIGTTSTRTIESLEITKDIALPIRGNTDLFIYPGFNFRFVKALLTNFHLPGSTLLILVYAFAGKELARKAYIEAIEKKYRFYSYGDAMLVL